LILDEWIPLEYSCCYLGAAERHGRGRIEIAVAGLAMALGIEAPPAMQMAPFITLDEYQRAIDRRLKAVDWNVLAEEAVRGGVGLEAMESLIFLTDWRPAIF
jgi:hypothetical protein